MGLAITGSELLTCLGDGDALWTALTEGVTGAAPLRHFDPARLRVAYGYQIDEDPEERSFRPSRWLARCVAEAVRQAGLDATGTRTVAIVGTGLRELRSLERWHADGAPASLPDLHFGRCVRGVVPGVQQVLTISNACAASGYALGMAEDLLALDEADAVIVAGTDGMTESMLAMIGRIGGQAAERVQPFDANRVGVLLGEGAAAVVLRRMSDVDAATVQGVIYGTGLVCDAYHETAPHVDGVLATMRDAYQRAGVNPKDIGLVLAHGTGTALNDPTEAAALRRSFAGVTRKPLVTAIKGATGHTSGGAALKNLLVALRAMTTGSVPPVVGLHRPIPETEGLELVIGAPAPTTARLAQVNAFGFGGVNAVTIVGMN